MKPIEELKAEHDGILQMLRVLRTVSAHLTAGRRVEALDIDSIISFLRTFADKCHHAKEETSLFPALQQAGMAVDSGPLAVMLDEHRQGRELIATMAEQAGKYSPCNLDAGREFAAAARGYSDLLTRHIDKENTVLFPMAEQMLTGARQFELREEFDKIEKEVVGDGRHEELHAELRRLSGKYLG